jgi:hypothetical protein
LSKYKFLSLHTKGFSDSGIFTCGLITVTGNPPESVIFYGACLNLETMVDAPIAKEIYAVAPIVQQIYNESVKIVKKSRLY